MRRFHGKCEHFHRPGKVVYNSRNSSMLPLLVTPLVFNDLKTAEQLLCKQDEKVMVQAGRRLGSFTAMTSLKARINYPQGPYRQTVQRNIVLKFRPIPIRICRRRCILKKLRRDRMANRITITLRHVDQQ